MAVHSYELSLGSFTCSSNVNQLINHPISWSKEPNQFQIWALWSGSTLSASHTSKRSWHILSGTYVGGINLFILPAFSFLHSIYIKASLTAIFRMRYQQCKDIWLEYIAPFTKTNLGAGACRIINHRVKDYVLREHRRTFNWRCLWGGRPELERDIENCRRGELIRKTCPDKRKVSGFLYLGKASEKPRIVFVGCVVSLWYYLSGSQPSMQCIRYSKVSESLPLEA